MLGTFARVETWPPPPRGQALPSVAADDAQHPTNCRCQPLRSRRVLPVRETYNLVACSHERRPMGRHLVKGAAGRFGELEILLCLCWCTEADKNEGAPASGATAELRWGRLRLRVHSLKRGLVLGVLLGSVVGASQPFGHDGAHRLLAGGGPRDLLASVVGRSRPWVTPTRRPASAALASRLDLRTVRLIYRLRPVAVSRPVETRSSQRPSPLGGSIRCRTGSLWATPKDYVMRARDMGWYGIAPPKR